MLISLPLLAIGVQLYRTFLYLASFRTFALTVVSLCLEALPFLLLGSFAAALVRSYLPAGLLARIARKLGPAGIPLATLSGLVAPVCECAIVPTVRGLREKGLPLPYAITILVSVPIINPVVIASTIAAFPGRADLVVARFLGGGAVAMITGFVFFAMYGNRTDVPRPHTSRPHGGDAPQKGHTHGHPHVHPHPFDTLRVRRAHPVSDVVNATLHEFLEVTRYFVVGAILSSLLQVAVPPEAFTRLSSSLVVAALAMIALAFILSVCSEADAFLGKAFLPLMPAPAVIAFLVFGPMMDLKNAAMLRGVITGKQLAGLTALLTGLVVAMAAVLQGVWT
ncbi:MAG: permease [Alkalispirochaeta sp.]